MPFVTCTLAITAAVMYSMTTSTSLLARGLWTFPPYSGLLFLSVYNGTVTLEVKAEHLLESRNRIQRMLDDIGGAKNGSTTRNQQ